MRMTVPLLSSTVAWAGKHTEEESEHVQVPVPAAFAKHVAVQAAWKTVRTSPLGHEPEPEIVQVFAPQFGTEVTETPSMTV